MRINELLSVMVLSFLAVTTDAQQTVADKALPVRVLVNAEVGENVDLGYFPLSKSVGPSVEMPFGHLFELQADAAYSNDRRVLTVSSNELGAGTTGIVWVNHRLGVTGRYEHHWLWTSQFGRTGSQLSPGLAIRDDLGYPGRTYLAYSFVGGCFWGTPSNPCQLEPGKTRAVNVAQDFAITSYARIGFHGSVFHFCDGALPNSTATTCHYGISEFLSFSVEFPKRTGHVSY